MDTEPLHSDFWDLVTGVLKLSLNRGQDPAEALHRAGLLLTPSKDKEIRLQAMNYLLIQITNWRPAEFMRRHGATTGTPAEMYREIVQFIEEHIQWWEKEQ